MIPSIDGVCGLCLSFVRGVDDFDLENGFGVEDNCVFTVMMMIIYICNIRICQTLKCMHTCMHI